MAVEKVQTSAQDTASCILGFSGLGAEPGLVGETKVSYDFEILQSPLVEFEEVDGKREVFESLLRLLILD